MVFGVDNLEVCKIYLFDYGFDEVGENFFEVLDGIGFILCVKDDLLLFVLLLIVMMLW